MAKIESKKQKYVCLAICLSVIALITACQAPNLNSNAVSQVKDALASAAPNLTPSASASGASPANTLLASPSSSSASTATAFTNGYNLKINGKSVALGKDGNGILSATLSKMANASSIIAVNTVIKTTTTTEVTCNSGADRVCGYSIGVGGILNTDRTALEPKSSTVSLNFGDFGKQELYQVISGLNPDPTDVFALKIENNALVGKYIVNVLIPSRMNNYPIQFLR